MIRLTLRWLFLLVATIFLIVSAYFYITYDSNNPSAEILKNCKGAIIAFTPALPSSEFFNEHFGYSNDGAASTIKDCIEKTMPKLYLQAFQAGLFFFFSILFFFFALRRPGTF